MNYGSFSQRNKTILIGIVVTLVVCLCLVSVQLRERQKAENERMLTKGSQENSLAEVSQASAQPVSQPRNITGITMSNYDRLKTGMTYKQVAEILGKDGIELSSNEIAGIKTAMYQWQGESLGANMNAMFQSGKLISKAQSGLK